jgi:broad specificity phosphatase PhoE
MIRIILVRHGETEANRQRIVQGRKIDLPLNQTGLDQAEILAQRLAKEDLHHIYTSPQRRAYQTAEAISRYHPHTPFTVCVDLAENSMGRLDGIPLKEVDAEFPDADWDDDSFRESVGAESHAFYEKHFTRHIPPWLSGHEGKTIVVSTHGGKLKTVLRSLVNPEYLEWVNREHPQNTSLAEVEWSTEKGGRLLKYNDTSHLKNQAPLSV